MSSISEIIKQRNADGRKALIPYIMAGDPSLTRTKKYIFDLERAGADIIELGVPFSDPLADGPTIQMAAERSLKRGTNLKNVISLVEDVRKNSNIPLVLMTYFNPVFKYGTKKFIRDAVRAGVNGVIIPDLIPDEAYDFIYFARQSHLDTIFLLAPTSTPDRIRKVVRSSTGFVYFVSITGITGAKLRVSRDLKDKIASVKKQTRIPVAIGFGISNAKEAALVSRLADGIIIGSAIVKLISKKKDIISFVKSIRKAI